MAIARLTSKGQVTIPKSVRDALSLHTGDKLEFVVRQSGDALIRPITRNVDDVFGKLHKPGRKPVSVEEMDSAIRQRTRRVFK
jgi:AbrB family looped-hinge helix DNA binding protein